MADDSGKSVADPKSQLQKDPPDKLAPATVEGYTVVLLERGTDLPHVQHTLQSMADDDVNIQSPCPLVVCRTRTLADAYLTQYELSCSDSIAVILRDAVVLNADPQYLQKLYTDLRYAEEFAPVTIFLASIPADEAGKDFLRKFFGQIVGINRTQIVTLKKARYMLQYAAKLGIQMTVDRHIT